MKKENPIIPEDIERLTDEELTKKYDELDSNVTNSPIIKEMQLRGLLEGKYTPKDGTFKSTTRL